MEETLLCLFLADEKVNIIHEKHIYVSILLPEIFGLPLPDRLYELIGKLLSAHVEHSQPACRHEVSYGMEKVGLSQSDSTVKKQGIIDIPWFFRHTNRRGVGQAIAVAYDEVIKGVFGVKGGGIHLPVGYGKVGWAGVSRVTPVSFLSPLCHAQRSGF
ncbi:unnamed protein product [marine sediment metagenome]|uniref:Uncharacterized protein n=1 Tax=marine sediment metagenome TaxID=412755 RepID=X0WQW5_9ZZZZ